jgi:hypothetical protein
MDKARSLTGENSKHGDNLRLGLHELLTSLISHEIGPWYFLQLSLDY